MLNQAVALLILQAVVQKAPPAAPPAAAASETAGKAEACIAMPVPADPGGSELQWYIDGDTIRIAGKAYQKYGLPRVLSPQQIEYRTTVLDGFFYGVRGVAEPEIIYLLVDLRACLFQPYYTEG